MTRVSERICGWLGWCPDARILPASQPVISATPLENPALLPDAGSPGSGRIRRGTDIAAESMKILARNGRLIWFSFLMFLTFPAMVATDRYIRNVFEISTFPGVMDSSAVLWGALTFAAAFIVHFVFFTLAAGLVICVSQIPQGNPITLRDSVSRAWSHKRSIAGWTLIGALLWIPAGIFTIGFFLITLFALPAIVLDNKDLAAAIRESVAIFRRMWVETYISFGIILLVTIGFVLAALFSLGQAVYVYGLVNGDIIPGMIWLAVSVLMAIGLVVMGIATCILYGDAKAGVLPDR